jgi:hypothetical protein
MQKPTPWLALVCATLATLVALPTAKGRVQFGEVRWSTPMNLSNSPMSSIQPAIAADASGMVHVFWSEAIRGEPHEEGQPGRPGDAIFYTRWDGTSWSQPNDIFVTDVQWSYQPMVAVDPFAQLHLIWVGAFQELYYSRAAASEGTSAQTWAAPNALARSAIWADIVSDGQGTLHVVYSQRGEYPGLYHVKSSNDDYTWSEPVTVWETREPNMVAVEVRLAVDGAGRIHAAWTQQDDRSAAAVAVLYSRSVNGGSTWSQPLEVAVKSETDIATNWINVAAVGENEIHLVWNDGPYPYRFHQWSTDGGETWTPPAQMMVFGPTARSVTRWSDMAVDSAGVLHLVTHIRAVGPDLLTGFFHVSWNGQSWGELQQIDLPADHQPRLAVTEGNKLHLVAEAINQGEIWYVAGQTSAPRVPSQPLPTLTPEPTRTQEPTVSPTRQPTATPEARDPLSAADTRREDMQFPVLMGILPALLLIAVVVLVRAGKVRHF